MNELQSELINQIRKYRLKNIDPLMEEDDKNSTFRMSIFQDLSNLGIAGMVTPEEYGGSELSYYDLCLALEEIAKSSVPYAVTLSVSIMVQSAISNFGSKSQKQQYLPKLSSGKTIGSFALSESGAGSDAASISTTAKKTDEGYVINGSKMWITSAGVSEVYLVFAKSNNSKEISAFLIDSNNPGMQIGKNESKMGWRTSMTREVTFKNCKVSHNDLLGKEGDGFKIAMSSLDKGRFTIGSIAVGLSERALDEAIKYSMIRKQFNNPIFEFQGIQFMISDLATEIEASRLLVEKAAKLYDQNSFSSKIASMAKLKATDTAMKVTTDAVQILGGVGYTTEYPVERLMRDAKVLQIVEGTNQIQKVIISKNIKNEYS
ncbi:MAG: acyl-CoA dehydrogenase [Bdellovibrionales bacterium]|jgi:butyryl-CoA dehydrogenase|nr:acyl-CoA dehydrogenase [Bdellovibrionales bacterium]